MSRARRRAASTDGWALSVRIAAVLEGFERGDDPGEVVADVAVVVRLPGPACSFREGDELKAVVMLAAVDRQARRRGLEIGQVRQALGWGRSCCGGRPQYPFGRLP